jgi:methionyl-tRNA synthetase
MEAINIKAYADDHSQIDALKACMKALKIKFEVFKDTDSTYNPEFVAKINKSRKQALEGQTVDIALDEIWK